MLSDSRMDVKKCGTEDAFYFNAALTAPPAAKKNPSATSFRSNSRDNAKQYTGFNIQKLAMVLFPF